MDCQVSQQHNFCVVERAGGKLVSVRGVSELPLMLFQIIRFASSQGSENVNRMSRVTQFLLGKIGAVSG